MGNKLFSDELPVHKATVDTWIATLIQAKLGMASWIAPLGADGIVPSQFLPPMSLTWGSITGVLADQTDLNTALAGKATTISPAFSGTPTAPTASAGTNNQQIATTAFVTAITGTLGSSISTAPIPITVDTTLTADDVVNKYYTVNEASNIEIVLPSAIGLSKKAFNFVIQNTGTGTVIIRDSSGSLFDSVSPDKLMIFSIQDDTAQNGYTALINLDLLPPSSFITPTTEVYKSGIVDHYGGSNGGRGAYMIELATNKWAITYSTTNTEDTYVQIFEWTGSVFNYGTAVEVTETYNSAYIWKQSDTLLGCGLETGEGANYMRSIAISGLELTLNPVLAVNTTTATYHWDTVVGKRLSDTQSLISYIASSTADPTVRVATVNGTSWTLGTAYAITASGSFQGLYMVSATEFLYLYYYNYMRIRRGTISGSTITLNAEDIIDALATTTTLSPCVDADNFMFDRGDGTYCIYLSTTTAGIVVNFSMTSGVYAEIGTLTLTGGDYRGVGFFKMSNNRAVILVENSTDTTILTAHVIDYSTAVPTLVGTKSLDNLGGVSFDETFDYSFVSGQSSFALRYWDNINEEYALTEISLGGITI